MAKTKHPEKYEYAEMLYLKGVSQKSICEKVGVTPNTVSNWKNQGAWEAKRAAREISVDQMISKALVKINEMLDKEDFSAEEFAKTLSPLKNLQTRVTPDDKVATMMDFGDWLIAQVGLNPEVTDELVKKLTSFQDTYILKVIQRDNG